MNQAPTVTLSHGTTMPRIGLGTSPMNDADAERAVATALELGYRLIDTAENYRNEAGVGRALAGAPRDELFVTSKFNKAWHSVEGPRTAFEASAEKLGVDYLDLLLIHWPNPEQDRYVEAWQGLIALREAGLVKAIGTSNFKPAHLQRLIDETGVAPEVNQIQLSPVWVKAAEREFHAAHGIVTEAWSPLGKGTDLLDHPVLQEIAKAHGRTPGQVILRWETQQDVVPIPKSADRGRLADNLAVFDFDLTEDQLAALAALDGTAKAAADSDRFGH
ncbi:aldo/keto reductase [Kribbella sandramycini]|uniref:2,5-diketo-D-gluconate reductase A n=1 Tax=Kribbella sandramycini TaxID=60450 RepID=A0A7Y4L3H6_9ACTN|nr:aldo/keto reductase [Kribbella sandramycini]MBB6570499.1 2,5-diketo-D-gluconate reductase A [Kribbella sandramycini]NOL43645.1 aldo/keto reductase [Kribbella sandramycini]